MKTIITGLPGKVSAADFAAAMSPMHYIVAKVDKKIKLPHPDHQYLEWVIKGELGTRGQPFAFGRIAYVHDTRYLARDQRVVENSPSWVFNKDGCVEVVTDPLHRIYSIFDIDLETILSEKSAESMIKDVSEQISGFFKRTPIISRHAVVLP